MIVIPPIPIVDSNLVSSNVPEPSSGEVVWNSSTNYAVNQEVIRTTTHRKYRSVLGGVDSGLPENTPTKWQDIGPTNKWAMFDKNRSMSTVRTGGMIVEIAPNKRIDSIALLGVQAKKVIITVSVGGVAVYGPIERNMNARNTLTWSQYFFGEFDYIPSLLLQDIPPYSGAIVKIEFQNDSTLDVKCSGVILGAKVYLGLAQYSAKSDSLNFSKIERDEFGNSQLLPRRTVPKFNVSVWSDKMLVNQIRKVRTELNAVPALWSALDDKYEDPYFEALFAYGIYKQFEIDIAQPSVAITNLEIEEL